MHNCREVNQLGTTLVQHVHTYITQSMQILMSVNYRLVVVNRIVLIPMDRTTVSAYCLGTNLEVTDFPAMVHNVNHTYYTHVFIGERSHLADYAQSSERLNYHTIVGY